MTDRLGPLVAFFERERDRRPLRGLAIVIGSSAVALVGGLALLLSLPDVDQPTVAFATGSGTVEAGAASLLGTLLAIAFPVVAWLVYAAVVYGITAVGGASRGGFYRFATLLAWGWLPALVVSLAWLVALLVNVATTPAPETIGPGCPYCQQVQTGPLMDAVRAFDTVGILASGVIWVAAIEVGRDVGRRVAVVCAGVLVALNLALFLTETLLV